MRDRYGDDSVAQIITFGSFLARGVMRNVGRVLEMPLGQVDKLAKLVPQNPAAPVNLKQAIESEPRLQEAAAADPRVDKDAEDRRDARRALFQRLDACGRHRHRRSAARRARAALSRSEIRHAGDPVQHEMGRAGGPRQIRFSRPQDADRAFDLRRSFWRGAASRSISRRSRSTTTRPTRCSGAARRSACSSWKARACARRSSRCVPTVSRTLSRSSRSIGRARWRIFRPIAR